MDNNTRKDSKAIHPLFILLNYICDPTSILYKLTDLEKWVLTSIVKHGGPEGMFVTQKTIANDLNVEVKSIENIIRKLKRLGIFSTKRHGRRNYYDFSIPPLGRGYQSVQNVALPPPGMPNTPSWNAYTIDQLSSSKKSSLYQKRENAKKHGFADSMNQMAKEKKEIEIHEERKRIELTSTGIEHLCKIKNILNPRK